MINKLLFTLLLSSFFTVAHGSTKSEQSLEEKRAVNDRVIAFLNAGNPTVYLLTYHPECQAIDNLVAIRLKYLKACDSRDVGMTLLACKQAKDILYGSAA